MLLLGAVAVGAAAFKIVGGRKGPKKSNSTPTSYDPELVKKFNAGAVAEAVERRGKEFIKPGVVEASDLGISNKDFMKLTGVELNEGYTALESIYNTCVAQADRVCAHFDSMYGMENCTDSDGVADIRKVVDLMKPMLQSIQFVRLNEAKS